VYNAGTQKVEGYTVSISDPLYTETDFSFLGEAAAKGTDTGNYPMGLTEGQFTNGNDNFEVTFTVTDGSLEITPRKVRIIAEDKEKIYGDEDPTLTFRTEGLAGTDYITVTLKREAGEDIGFLMTELAERFEASRHMPTPPEVDLSWDTVKDNLTVRLLEKNRNIDFISNMPYVDVGNGLVITADINMPGDMDGGWRVAVNHNVLDQLGVDRNEIFSSAMSNAKIYDRAVLTDMTQALFSPDRENLLDRDAPLDPEDIGAMYVLTTEGSNLGACALYYPDVKEMAAELMGSGYYVLPSSVHEVILVPDTAGHNEKELCDMVKQANRTVVEPQEVLSDSVYHYDKDSRMLSKVDPERDKADRVAEAR
jgi:hypothetical protein